MKKAQPKTKAQGSARLIKLTLVRSLIGTSWRQRRSIEALGLKKRGAQKLVKDHPAQRGQIFQNQHLLKVEMVAQKPQAQALREGV